MFPSATGVNAGGIGKRFESGNFFGGQHHLGGLGGLDDVAFLGGTDERHGALGDGPSDTHLGAGSAILLADGGQLVGEGCELLQHGVVLLAAVALLGQRVLLVVLTAERTLLQHHVGPELNAVLAAVVQHTAFSDER